MKKSAPILALFLIFLFTVAASAQEPAEPELTRATWGAAVGFAPDLKVQGYEPGMEIGPENVDKFDSILPDTAATMIRKYGMRIKTQAYEPYAPSDGYIAATNQHRGQAKLIDIGDSTTTREIENFQAGMPFPHPKNGREVAWNFILAYGGDDSESTFQVFWISPKRGVERSETWKTLNIRAKHRTDIPPLPSVPLLVQKNVIAAVLTQALAPTDKKGYASLYYGYLEPKEPSGWLYMPAQRRSIRLTFGLKGEAWNNTDLLYEDIRGYTGSPEWMNWKLVRKATLLCPHHTGITQGKGNETKVYDFENKPHWNPTMNWELRPMYVLEATPKLRGYPYSRMVLYVDAESSHVFAKSAYDRKGNLWKMLINAGIKSTEPRKKPGKIGMSLVVDIQSEHATAFFWHSQKNNVGVDPAIFSQTTLRKLGR